MSDPHTPLFVLDAKCKCENASDLEYGLKYNFGKFEGLCLDNCHFTPPQMVKKEDQKDWLKNIRHKDRAWQAKFDFSAIENTWVLFENFDTKVHHVAIVYQFSSPLKLSPLNQSDSSQIAEITSFVISPEAAPPLDHEYSLTDAFGGNYAITYQVVSLDDYLKNSRAKDYEVIKYPLNFNQLEMAELLHKNLRQAEDTSLREKYHLFTNNCATKTLKAIFNIKEVHESWWHWLDPLQNMPLSQLGTKRTLFWWDAIDITRLDTPHVVDDRPLPLSSM